AASVAKMSKLSRVRETALMRPPGVLSRFPIRHQPFQAGLLGSAAAVQMLPSGFAMKASRNSGRREAIAMEAPATVLPVVTGEKPCQPGHPSLLAKLWSHCAE